MNISVSSRTIQKTLHNLGYSGHAAKKKPFISEQNRKKRHSPRVANRQLRRGSLRLTPG